MRVKTVVLAPVALAIAGVLASCAMLNGQPKPANEIQFNYAIENGPAVGVVQAFDMDGNTVLQVSGLDLRQPKVFDTKGAQIPSKIVGQYLVLTGTHDQVMVQSGDDYASIARRRAAAPVAQSAIQTPPLQAQAAVVAPASRPANDPATTALAKEVAETEAAAAELARIRKELADLKAMLASLSDGQTLRVNTSAKPTYATPDNSTTVVRVSFKYNSAQFDPTGDDKRILQEYAPKAQRISVTGYTDSSVATAADTTIANNRAQAARKYLTKLGVDEQNIDVNGQASGGFIADNNTTAGRAKNRRVDIEMSIPGRASNNVSLRPARRQG